MESRLNSSNYATVAKSEVRKDILTIEVDVVGDPLRPRDSIITIVANDDDETATRRPPKRLPCKNSRVTAGFGLHTWVQLEFLLKGLPPQCELYFTYNPGWGRCRLNNIVNFGGGMLVAKKSSTPLKAKQSLQGQNQQQQYQDQRVTKRLMETQHIEREERTIKASGDVTIVSNRIRRTRNVDMSVNERFGDAKDFDDHYDSRQEHQFFSPNRNYPSEPSSQLYNNRNLQESEAAVSSRHGAFMDVLSKRLKSLRRVSVLKNRKSLVEMLTQIESGVLLAVLPKINIKGAENSRNSRTICENRAPENMLGPIRRTESIFDFDPGSLRRLLPRLTSDLEYSHDEFVPMIGRELVRLIGQLKLTQSISSCRDELFPVFNNAKRALRSVRVTRNGGPLLKTYTGLRDILASEFL